MHSTSEGLSVCALRVIVEIFLFRIGTWAAILAPLQSAATGPFTEGFTAGEDYLPYTQPPCKLSVSWLYQRSAYVPNLHLLYGSKSDLSVILLSTGPVC